MLTIYHNPRCSKSRQTLQLINENNVDVQIIEYLNNIPTESELRAILDKLGLEAKDILRKGETIFKEEYKGKTLSNDEWIVAMVKHPKLIERPIVVKDNKAILGRPPENVLQLL